MKDYDNSFNGWIDKKMTLYKMSSFTEPYSQSKNKIKNGIDLSNYATKSNLKEALIHQNLADLANLKSDVDKLDIDKLEITPADLSELNNVLKNDVVKNTVYDQLVKKVNAIQTIDTSDL